MANKKAINHIRPTVSIIVPTRNRGHWLQVCLNAIYKQTFTDYEVLILDDGSEQSFRDQTQELLKQYDERFQLHLIHPAGVKGTGASYVRNHGISMARGQYLAFCDDDDYWCRGDYLCQAIDALQKQKGEVCFSGLKICDTEGAVINDNMMRHVQEGLNTKQKLSNSQVYQISRKQVLTYPDYAHLNITIVQKSLAQQIGGFWECTPYCEDVAFFIRVCDQANTILFRPEICAVHNAPHQRVEQSITNQMLLQDKRLLEMMVYQYLLINCHRTEALAFIRKSLSYSQKKVAEELQTRKQAHINAACLARSAWGVYPTIKWGLYALWLTLKAFKHPKN